MASGKSDAAELLVLSFLLRNTTDSPTAPTESNIKVALTTDNPTDASAGTGLTGTGYTAGGTAIGFGAPSSGQTTGDDSGAISWTNGSGGDWTIAGLVIHDAASGHPTASDVIYWDDEFDVTVPNGATLEIPQDGITITEG